MDPPCNLLKLKHLVKDYFKEFPCDRFWFSKADYSVLLLQDSQTSTETGPTRDDEDQLVDETTSAAETETESEADIDQEDVEASDQQDEDNDEDNNEADESESIYSAETDDLAKVSKRVMCAQHVCL